MCTTKHNPHAISTLANESFFSDLTRLDKESTYYPKACNIPHLLGKVVTLNYFKHKPDKSYSLQTTLKGSYPVHILDINDEDTSIESQSYIYKNHFFDNIDLHNSFRSRKTDLSMGLNPLHSVQSVCRHYRMDESLVDPQYQAQMTAQEMNDKK